MAGAGVVAGVLKLFDVVGLGQPWWYVGAVKLLLCALSRAIPVGMYRFARRHFSEAAARAALLAGAFWYELVGFAHKPMTEFVATAPLLLAATIGLLLALISLVLLSHSLQTHKEYRFIFAVIPLWLLLGADLVTRFAGWVAARAGERGPLTPGGGSSGGSVRGSFRGRRAEHAPYQERVYQAWSWETALVRFVRNQDPIFAVYRYLSRAPGVAAGRWTATTSTCRATTTCIARSRSTTLPRTCHQPRRCDSLGGGHAPGYCGSRVGGPGLFAGARFRRHPRPETRGN